MNLKNPAAAMPEGQARRIALSLPIELCDDLDAAVSNGEFQSIDEAVTDAIEEWRVQRAVNHLGVEELQRLCQEGIDSGFAPYEGIEAIIAEARARYRGA